MERGTVAEGLLQAGLGLLSGEMLQACSTNGGTTCESRVLASREEAPALLPASMRRHTGADRTVARDAYPTPAQCE